MALLRLPQGLIYAQQIGFLLCDNSASGCGRLERLCVDFQSLFWTQCKCVFRSLRIHVGTGEGCWGHTCQNWKPFSGSPKNASLLQYGYRLPFNRWPHPHTLSSVMAESFLQLGDITENPAPKDSLSVWKRFQTHSNFEFHQG